MMIETRLRYSFEASASLISHQNNVLELNGRALKPGDWLELRVFGYWIPGQVNKDAHGWYMQTLDAVGIRLCAGLQACFSEKPLVAAPPSEAHHQIPER
ncbi:MAG TPA: DUF5348 domain-containing protein [Ktedonobacteraceae bacterium]